MAETQVLNSCLCGDEIDDPLGVGKNGYLVVAGEDDRCRVRCKRDVVIPACRPEIENR